MKQRKMNLGLFVAANGHHIGGWRHPDAEANAAENLTFLQKIAKTAEEAKFDMFFVGDGLNTDPSFPPSVIARLEPMTLLASIAGVTKNIGLAATISTTYGEPYHVARQLASLDHLSNGRAAWNIVTTSSAQAAENFGEAGQMEHRQRYERAMEFVEVAKGLWDSWEADAFLRNKESGQYIDPTKLHTLNHKGNFFSVKGPLNISRSPQHYPVLIQAGSSNDGQKLAAQHAEVIFTAQNTLETAKRFYANVKTKINAAGRNPDAVKVMPGIVPIVGETREEAEKKYKELQKLIDLPAALSILSARVGEDVSSFPLDQPLPRLKETNGIKSRAELIYELAERKNLTLRELALEVAGSKGHHIFIGSGNDVADHLEEWFLEGGADGFNIMPPYFPGGLEDFVRLVIPILQERGLFRKEYNNGTLRDNLTK